MLAQGIEQFAAAREDLMHIRLVAGVEDQWIRRGVKHAVHGYGELHDTQVRTQVAAHSRNLLHKELANFTGKISQLLFIERLEICGRGNLFENTHAVWLVSIRSCTSTCS